MEDATTINHAGFCFITKVYSMKFSETNSSTLPIVPKVFVYFLILDNEVVYVGKTQHGIVRPFSHHDKKFNRIEIILVDENFLNISEEYFITKYSPIYNLDLKQFVSMEKARDLIRKYANKTDFSIKDLKSCINRIAPGDELYNNSERCISSKMFWRIFQIVCKENNVKLPNHLIAKID